MAAPPRLQDTCTRHGRTWCLARRTPRTGARPATSTTLRHRPRRPEASPAATHTPTRAVTKHAVRAAPPTTPVLYTPGTHTRCSTCASQPRQMPRCGRYQTSPARTIALNNPTHTWQRPLAMPYRPCRVRQHAFSLLRVVDPTPCPRPPVVPLSTAAPVHDPCASMNDGSHGWACLPRSPMTTAYRAQTAPRTGTRARTGPPSACAQQPRQVHTDSAAAGTLPA